MTHSLTVFIYLKMMTRRISILYYLSTIGYDSATLFNNQSRFYSSEQTMRGKKAISNPE